MGAYILSPSLRNPDYIIQRIGDEAEDWLQVAQGTIAQKSRQSIFTRIRAKGLGAVLQKAREKVALLSVGFIAGSNAKSAFEEGLFRASGEIHRWMYDKFSLGRLLGEIGFTDICVCKFDESRIPNFTSYLLDNTPKGTIRKADSLFMEAKKP